MKIRKVTCWVLRIPFTFPLVHETQHALANLVEVETDDGLKGHALSTYPLKYATATLQRRGVDRGRPHADRGRTDAPKRCSITRPVR